MEHKKRLPTADRRPRNRRLPTAFMSYARFDDDYDNNWLVKFRDVLEEEVQRKTGKSFRIFQDQANIKTGENWKQKIAASLDGADFLIAIITPSYLESKYCRYEFMRFFKREQQSGRGTLVFPIYYVDSLLFNDESRRSSNEVASILSERHYADWRGLEENGLTEDLDSPEMSRAIKKIAKEIATAIYLSEQIEEGEHNGATSMGWAGPLFWTIALIVIFLVVGLAMKSC